MYGDGQMSRLHRALFSDGTDVKRKALIWNSAAGAISAGESVLIPMVVTRLIGLGDAGILTLGYAVGNLMATIGKSGGVRTLQVTDVAPKHTFAEYLGARLSTLLLMIAISIGYLLHSTLQNGYTLHKVIVLLVLCSKCLLEAFEDVFAGECQKQGRLDVGARMFVFRSITFMAVAAVMLLAVRRMLPALVTALAAAVLLEVLQLTVVLPEMSISLCPSLDRAVLALLRKCLPLAVCTFSFFYITNAPKYAIDRVMDDEAQACYGFIALPVFAIELLSGFIYQPSLVDFAKDLADKHFGKVRNRILMQIVILAGLTALAWGAAYLLGIPLLSMLFAVDLARYKSEMLVLVLAGGVLAVMAYFTTVLTAMDHPMLIMFGYLSALLLSLFLYTPVIRSYGIMGGVKLYLTLCILVSVYEAVCITVSLRERPAQNQ